MVQMIGLIASGARNDPKGLMVPLSAEPFFLPVKRERKK